MLFLYVHCYPNPIFDKDGFEYLKMGLLRYSVLIRNVNGPGWPVDRPDRDEVGQFVLTGRNGPEQGKYFEEFYLKLMHFIFCNRLIYSAVF